MLNYSPLKKTLKEKGIVLSDLREEIGLNPKTQAIINRNEPVNLATIYKICKYLNVPIEKVIEFDLTSVDNKNENKCSK